MLPHTSFMLMLICLIACNKFVKLMHTFTCLLFWAGPLPADPAECLLLHQARSAMLPSTIETVAKLAFGFFAALFLNDTSKPMRNLDNWSAMTKILYIVLCLRRLTQYALKIFHRSVPTMFNKFALFGTERPNSAGSIHLTK